MDTVNKMLNLKGKTIFILFLTALLCITGTLAFFTDTTTASIEFSLADSVDFDYSLAGNINNSTEVTITSLGDEVYIAVTETNKEDRDLFSKVTLTADWNGATDISRVTFKDTATGNTLTPTISNGKLTLTLPGNKIAANGTLNHKIQVILTGEASGSIMSDTLAFVITSDVSVVKDSWAETVGPVNLKLHTNLKYPTKLEVQTPPDETYYVPGENFDPTGMVLKVTYNDNSTALIKYDETEGYMIDKTPDNGVDNYAALSGTEFDIQNVLNLTEVYTYTPQGDYKKGGTAYSDGQVYFTFVYNESTDKYDITFEYNGNTYSYSEDVFMNNYVNNASYTIELNDKPDDVQVGTLPHAAYTENGVTVECDVIITVAAPILKNTYGYNTGNVSLLDKTELLSYLDSDTITEVEFVTSFDGLDKDTMDYADVSDKQNGSVLAWVDGSKLYVGGKTGVYANEQLTGLFSHTFRDGAHYYYDDITSIDVTNLKVIGANDKGYPVTRDLAQVFYGCEALTEIKGLSNWNTASVTEMSGLFGKTALTKITGVSNWDTSKVTSFASMFYDDYYLEDASELDGWDTSSLTSASSMFEDCTALKSAPIANWDFSGIDGSWGKTADGMFNGCENLTELTIPASLGYFDSYWALNTSSLDTITFLHAPGDTLEIDEAGYTNGAFRVYTSVDGSVSYSATPLKTTLLLPNDTDGSVKDKLYAYDFAYDNRSLQFDVTVANATGGSVKESTSNLTAWSEYALGLSLTPQADTGYQFVNWKITYTDLDGTAHTDETTDLTNYTMPYAHITITPVWERTTYTISFNANGGSGTMSDMAMTYGTAKNLTANAFTKTGYTFEGWATSATGAVAYADKQSVNNLSATDGATVTLYAKWIANSYTIKFNANSGSGTISDLSMTYDTAKNLTANSFSKTGYTFAGWATSAAGSVVYADKAEVKNLTANKGETVNLYAVWTANSYTIKFNANGGSGSMDNIAMTYDTAKNLTANSFTNSGYTFAGWATSATGAVVYADKAEVKNLTANKGETVNLYAVWTANGYTIKFNANGGNGSMGDLAMTYGTAKNLTANAFTRTGYTFAGWATSSNGAVTFADKVEVNNLTATNGATVTLYAKWTANTYSVKFNANGGNGSMNNQEFTYDQAQNLTANAFTRDGYEFLGWATSASGAKAYSNSQSVNNLTSTNGATVNLYAVWKQMGDPILKYRPNGNTDDYHAYKDSITEIVFLQEFNLPDNFDTTAGYGPWDVSSGNDEGVMAYMVGTKVYICANAGYPTKVIANTNSNYAFSDLTALTTLTNIDNLDTSSVTTMSRMFANCSSLIEIDLNDWTISKVNDLSQMFDSCTGLTKVEFNKWDTSNVTSLQQMFLNCTNLTTVNIDSWNTSKVDTLNGMFTDCQNLKTINLNNWDTSNVTNMNSVFRNCRSLETIAVNNWNTSKVEKMNFVFDGCKSLKTLDVNSWDTSKVTTMINLFSYSGLESLELTNWDTSNVTYMYDMFLECGNLKELDLSGFDTSKLTDEILGMGVGNMFQNCKNLKTIYVSDKWDVQHLSSDMMFTGCTVLVGGYGTAYDSNHKDITYAVIDGYGTPGYMTGPMYTVMFDANGGEGTMNNQKMNVGRSIPLNSNTFTAPAGYTFAGWATSPDGDVIYPDGQSVKDLAPVKGSITLYAKWEENITGDIVVSYNSNDGQFNSGKQINKVGYNLETKTVTEISKTSNVGDDGLTADTTTGYGNNQSVTDVVTIPGAESLKVTITYQTQAAAYDWVCVYDGSVTPSQSNYSNSISGKLGGRTQKTKEYTINGDTVQFYFYSDNYSCNFYGYYATVTAVCGESNIVSGTYDEPTHINGGFLGWYTDAACTDGNEFNPETDVALLTSDITVYAKYFYPILQSWVSSLTSDFHKYSSTITEVEFMQEYTPPASVTYGPWDVSEAKNESVMAYMVGTKVYICANIGTPANVIANEDSSYIFSKFTQLKHINHLEFLDTSNVTNMQHMFSYCSSLTEIDLSGFTTSNVTDMSNMFTSCSNLSALDLKNFDTSNVTSINAMFASCFNLSEVDVTSFNTTNVTNMASMFYDCSNLAELDLSSFNTSSVTNTNSMFYDCSSLSELDVTGFDTSNVTDMGSMFASCSNLSVLDLKNFDTSNVTDMGAMFASCSNLSELDVTGFDTSNVTSMNSMFTYCSNLSELDVTGFNTSNVTEMFSMFAGCSNLSELDVTSFNTSNVIFMDLMFGYCSSLTELDLSSFDVSKVFSIDNMFRDNVALTTIYVSSLWNLGNSEEAPNMFTGCFALVGGNGTTYDRENLSATYARIDTASTPGYFTAKTSTASLQLNLNGGEVVE